jgi:hypothetical protein
MSCDTDDILPALTLTTSSNEISENQEQITITASINSDANEDILLPLSFSGTATFDFDYVTTESALIISSGNSSGSISISSMQDSQIEDIETIIISVESQNDVLVTSSSITISILDDDSDSDGDGINDSDDDCPNEAGIPEYNGCSEPLLIINEVLYDPSNSGLNGDANGDGVYAQDDDEFIEFANLGGTIDISGFTVSDAAAVRHTFPSGTIIPSGGVLVLFGGGEQTATGDFGGAIVQFANGFEERLNMNNAGDLVTLQDNDGEVILTFDIEPLAAVDSNPNLSYTRYPDLNLEPDSEGNLFYQHSSLSESSGTLFSPGTKIDGTNFN